MYCYVIVYFIWQISVDRINDDNNKAVCYLWRTEKRLFIVTTYLYHSSISSVYQLRKFVTFSMSAN